MTLRRLVLKCRRHSRHSFGGVVNNNFDGRERDLNLSSEYPYLKLPRMLEELEVGDVVWIGFHAHTYIKQSLTSENTNVTADIAWVVLLSRGGEDAWNAVTDSSPTPDW